MQSHYTHGGAYKTRLCHNFSNRGFCDTGIDCNFAHGEQDLRPGRFPDRRDVGADERRIGFRHRNGPRPSYDRRDRDEGPGRTRKRSQSPPPPRRKPTSARSGTPEKRRRLDDSVGGKPVRREKEWRREIASHKGEEEAERRRERCAKAEAEAEVLEDKLASSQRTLKETQARAATFSSHVDHAQKNLDKLESTLTKLLRAVKQVLQQQDDLKKQELKFRNFVSALDIDFNRGDVLSEGAEQHDGRQEIEDKTKDAPEAMEDGEMSEDSDIEQGRAARGRSTDDGTPPLD